MGEQRGRLEWKCTNTNNLEPPFPLQNHDMRLENAKLLDKLGWTPKKIATRGWRNYLWKRMLPQFIQPKILKIKRERYRLLCGLFNNRRDWAHFYEMVSNKSL
jgi:hypothetical protein